MGCKLERVADHQNLVNVPEAIAQIVVKVDRIAKAINDVFLGGVHLGKEAVKISKSDTEPFVHEVTAAGKTGRLVCEIQLIKNELSGVVTLWKPVVQQNGDKEENPVWQFVQPRFSTANYTDSAGQIHHLDFSENADNLSYALGLTFLVNFITP